VGYEAKLRALPVAALPLTQLRLSSLRSLRLRNPLPQGERELGSGGLQLLVDHLVGEGAVQFGEVVEGGFVGGEALA
jgi:hypothetical protein